MRRVRGGGLSFVPPHLSPLPQGGGEEARGIMSSVTEKALSKIEEFRRTQISPWTYSP